MKKGAFLPTPKKVSETLPDKIHFKFCIGWVEEERARKKVLEMRKHVNQNGIKTPKRALAKLILVQVVETLKELEGEELRIGSMWLSV